MNEDTIADVEKKAIDRVPNWFWGVAGIAFVSSIWLFFNGLNLGSIVNRYIDVRFEERKAQQSCRIPQILELQAKVDDLLHRIEPVEELSHEAHNKPEK